MLPFLALILVIDNYDSFTHNLIHLLRAEGEPVEVFRNDRIRVEEVRDLAPRRVVISPGPGHPDHAGISVDLVRKLPPEIPILGVCLGLQAIATAFLGRIVSAPSLVHGKTSPIFHTGSGLFAGLSKPMSGMRYHSLVVERESLPPELEVTAWLDDEEKTVMGLSHRARPLVGVQFHPESFLTETGERIVGNFLRMTFP